MSNSHAINAEDNHAARLMLLRQVLTLPVRFLRSIVVLPLLPPNLIFVVRLVGTWLSYAARGNLGTFNLLAFYYPAAESQGDDELRQRYVYMAWLATLFCGMLGALTGGFVAYRYLSPGLIPLFVVWGFCYMLLSYLQHLFQGTGDFNRLALFDICQTVLGFVASLAGLLLFGFKGYLVGLVLPIIVIVLLARNVLFPQAVSLPFQFVKRSFYEGSFFTLLGFVSSFVRGHEITWMALLPGIDLRFAGQYAVALSLATIQDGFVSSVSRVYQRKITKQLTRSRESTTVFRLVRQLAVLELLLSGITASIFMIGGLAFYYWLPNYEDVTWILPLVSLAYAIQRNRFYPGLVFKVDKKFTYELWGHLINLLAGASIFFAFWYLSDSLNFQCALNQVVGASLGTFFTWCIFFNKNRKAHSWRFNLFTLSVIGYSAASFSLYLYLLPHVIACILVAVSNILVISLAAYRFEKESFGMLIELLSNRQHN